MARGFGTLGSNTTLNTCTDKIVSSETTHSTTRSYAQWVYRVSSGGNNLGSILHKNTGSGNYEFIGTSTSSSGAVHGHLDYNRFWSGGVARWRTNGNLLAANTWVHTGVTYNAGSTSNAPLLYVNGVSQTVNEIAAPSGTLGTSTDAYAYGNRPQDNARCWDGMIAGAAIWDVILTADEMARLADGESPLEIRPASLVLYMPFLYGDSARDHINAANGTVTGAVDKTEHPLTYERHPGTQHAIQNKPFQLFIPSAYFTNTANINMDNLTWAEVSNSLPAGLDVDTNSGLVDGTPTALGVTSSTISVTDGTSTCYFDIDFKVRPNLDAITQPYTIRQNFGASDLVIDNEHWLNWTAGNTDVTGGTSGTQTVTTHHASVETNMPQDVFDTHISGSSMTFARAVSNGDYEVRLYLAHAGLSASTQCVLDISIEGSVVQNDYDLHTGAGEGGIVLSYEVTVADSALTVTVASVSGAQNPRWCAIEVIAIPSVSGATYLRKGETLNTVIQAASEGAAFILGPGIHRGQAAKLKKNQSVYLMPGAILNGSEVLTGASQDGSQWEYTGRTLDNKRTNVPGGYTPYTGYDWPEEPNIVFVDGEHQHHVTNEAAVNATGEYFFDKSGDKVIIGTDPSGKIVEQANTEIAFGGGVNGVTLQGLGLWHSTRIEKYATNFGMGTITPTSNTKPFEASYTWEATGFPLSSDCVKEPGGRYWLLKNFTVQRVAGSGVNIAHGMKINGIWLHECGYNAAEFCLSHYCDIEGLHASYGNYQRFDQGFGDANLKSGGPTGTYARGMYGASITDVLTEYAIGAGFWVDVYAGRHKITNEDIPNRMTGILSRYNNGNGIWYEISYNGHFYNCVVGNNGWAVLDLDASTVNDVFMDNVDGGEFAFGILIGKSGAISYQMSMRQQNRTPASDEISYHHNIVVLRHTLGRCVQVDIQFPSPDDDFWTDNADLSEIHFYENHYEIPSAAGSSGFFAYNNNNSTVTWPTYSGTNNAGQGETQNNPASTAYDSLIDEDWHPLLEHAILYRINCGSVGGTDESVIHGSRPWLSVLDDGYCDTTGTSVYSSTAYEPDKLHSSVPRYIDPRLFMSYREGVSTAQTTKQRWTFPVTAGQTIKVLLYFCDPISNSSADRVFDIDFDGVTVETAFDIYAEFGNAGGMAEYIHTPAGSTFTIDLVIDVGDPIISGIEILEYDAVSVNAPDIAISDGVPAELSAVNSTNVWGIEWEDDSDPGTIVSRTMNYTVEKAVGEHTFTLRMWDALGTVTTHELTLNVYDPPVITDPGSQSDAEGDTINLPISATDPAGGGLTWTIPSGSLPTGLSLGSGTGAVTGDIDYAASASSPFSAVIRATDTAGGYDEITLEWTVSNTNRAPVLAAIGNQDVDEGESLPVELSATDPDGNGLTFSVTLSDDNPAPAWVTLDDNLDGTATLTLAPQDDDTGVSLKVTVTDGSLTDTETFTVTVNDTITDSGPAAPVLQNVVRKLFITGM